MSEDSFLNHSASCDFCVVMGHVLKVVPSSRPESTCSSNDDIDLPSLAKFLKHPPAQGSKSASRIKEVTVDSEADSEEIAMVSRTSSSGV